MSPIDHQLHRLLKAASQAPDEVAALPASMQGRVLTELRRQQQPSAELAVRRLLGWSVVQAVVLALLCFVWAKSSDSTRESEALSLVNSSIQLALHP